MSYMKPTLQRQVLGRERTKLMNQKERITRSSNERLGILIKRHAKRLEKAGIGEDFPTIAEGFESDYRGLQADSKARLQQIDTELALVNREIETMALEGL